MELVAQKFSSQAASDQADREFYRSLTPEQRLDILLDLIAAAQKTEDDQKLARVYRIVKLHEAT
jgi:hypothetical protein